MRQLKIALGVLFVCGVAFFVARSCATKPHSRGDYENEPRPVVSEPQKTKKQKTPIKPAPVKTEQAPKMAIVLDDWGLNIAMLDTLIGFKRPFTIAVIPRLSKSTEIAEKAHQNGLGVILHMPMQPLSTKEILEPHTIRINTEDKVIHQYLEEGFVDVPFAEGMNNHMGSAATENERVMRTVLTDIKKRKLFFLDSQTSRKSVGPKIAKELGVPSTKRDIFIDNIAKKEEVVKQLKKAAQICVEDGRVVVIGHDKKVTLQAIQDMIPEFDREGIQLVLVKELLEV